MDVFATQCRSVERTQKIIRLKHSGKLTACCRCRFHWQNCLIRRSRGQAGCSLCWSEYVHCWDLHFRVRFALLGISLHSSSAVLASSYDASEIVRHHQDCDSVKTDASRRLSIHVHLIRLAHLYELFSFKVNEAGVAVDAEWGARGHIY